MPLKIDHVFIAGDVHARNANVLLRHGFCEGYGNKHPGQGTANRRFFFDDFMLEFLWVDNTEEATSERTKRTRLWERCNNDDSSINPFGIVFRSTGSDHSTAPFPTWRYRPRYVPPGEFIEFADEVTLGEPELVFLPFPTLRKITAIEPPHHALQSRRIRRICVGLPTANDLSKSSTAAAASGILTYFQSPEFLLQIVFEGSEKTVIDFRPHLPLVFVQE